MATHHVTGLEEGGVGVDECCFGEEAFAGLLVAVQQDVVIQGKRHGEQKECNAFRL